MGIVFGLRGPILSCSIGSKKNSRPLKSTFLLKFWPCFSKLVPVIWPFWGPKKSFFGLFESCFGVVQKWFRHTNFEKMAKISTKNVDFGGLENFFKPILHESMGPLSPKTMPKQF